MVVVTYSLHDWVLAAMGGGVVCLCVVVYTVSFTPAGVVSPVHTDKMAAANNVAFAIWNILSYPAIYNKNDERQYTCVITME